MQAEHPVPARNQARGGDGGPHLLAGIADQRGEAGRSAKAPVCPSDGAHPLGGWSIVEKNTAAAIDLQIYETRSHKGTGWELHTRPVGWNFARGSNSDDAPIPDQNRGFCMPAVTVKNSIRQDGMPIGD
jgi:hypothetical protein